MPISGVLETVLYAQDLNAARQFYETVLGLECIIQEPDRHVFFRCGNQVVLIFDPRATTQAPRTGSLPVPTHGATGAGHICFRADSEEIATWRYRLEQAGILIESDFEWPQGGRSIYFRDPAGNSVEFAEPRIWGLD